MAGRHQAPGTASHSATFSHRNGRKRVGCALNLNDSPSMGRGAVEDICFGARVLFGTFPLKIATPDVDAVVDLVCVWGACVGLWFSCFVCAT